MCRFIRKILGFIFVVIFIIIVPAALIKNNERLLLKSYFDEILLRKTYYENFNKGKSSINVITGSSHAKDFFNPNVFGPSWYNNANGGQYLPLSVMQLEASYKNKIKIDSLIISIDEFDLTDLKGEVGYNFYIYKNIFSETNYELNQKHSFFDHYWITFKFDIKLLKSYIKRVIFGNSHISSIKPNGFLPRSEAPFYDTRKEITYGLPSNFFWFNKLLEITKQNGTQLIIVITPKTKQYFDMFQVNEYREWKKFRKVLYERSKKDFILVDFERQYQEKILYLDLDHPNSKLRTIISDNLKESLKNN